MVANRTVKVSPEKTAIEGEVTGHLFLLQPQAVQIGRLSFGCPSFAPWFEAKKGFLFLLKGLG